jgi:hypothetical protein
LGTTFNIAANGQAAIAIPTNAEHTGSETVTDKGIHVERCDITVTAVSFQNFTADGAQIVPLRSLGTLSGKPIEAFQDSRTLQERTVDRGDKEHSNGNTQREHQRRAFAGCPSP